MQRGIRHQAENDEDPEPLDESIFETSNEPQWWRNEDDSDSPIESSSSEEEPEDDSDDDMVYEYLL